jgi:hypothetical protein
VNVTNNQQLAMFFACVWGGGLATWLWIRWAMKRDAAAEAEFACRIQPVASKPRPKATQDMYDAWREARLRFMRENPATAEALSLKEPPEDEAEYSRGSFYERGRD